MPVLNSAQSGGPSSGAVSGRSAGNVRIGVGWKLHQGQQLLHSRIRRGHTGQRGRGGCLPGRSAFAAIERPFIALAAIGEKAHARLIAGLIRDDLRLAALLHAVGRGRIGDLRLDGCGRLAAWLALAAVVGPFLALAAVGEKAEAGLAAVGGRANLQPAALLRAENRGRIGHPDLRRLGRRRRWNFL
jgi:hypothetical protein